MTLIDLIYAELKEGGPAQLNALFNSYDRVLKEFFGYCDKMEEVKKNQDEKQGMFLFDAYSKNLPGYQLIFTPSLMALLEDNSNKLLSEFTGTPLISEETRALMTPINMDVLRVISTSSNEPVDYAQFKQGLTYSYAPYKYVPEPAEEEKGEETLETLSSQTLTPEERRELILAEKERIDEYAKSLLGEEYAEYFNSRIDTDVKSIMEVYEGLFKAGLELENPLGVLVEKGYMYLDKKHMAFTRKDSMLAKLYKNYNGYVNNSLSIAAPNSKLTQANVVDNGYNYFPEFQVRNAFGVTIRKGPNGSLKMTKHLTWETYAQHIATNLKEIILRMVSNYIEQVPENDLDDAIDNALNQLRIALTSCIVVSEYDSGSSLKIRAYTKSLGVNAKDLKEKLTDPNNPLFSGLGKVGLCQQDKSGVLTLSIIFDEVAESRKPLFAYQAIELLKAKNVKPDWRNFIVGKNVLTDTMYTVDLSDANSYNCVIGAGARSGKGVTTLNILATALSEGFPILYMDGKPEMAQMLWDLGEKYQVPVYAVDINDKRKGMQYTNCPAGLEEYLPNIGGIVAYFKGVQLALAAATIRLANSENNDIDFTIGNFTLKGKERMVVVCDEIVKVKEKYDLTYMPFLTQIKKAGKKGTPTSEWQSRLLEWLDALDSNINGSLASEIPMARQNWFWLTQRLDKTTWSISTGDGAKTIVRGAVRTSKVLKLAGNGMTSGNNTLALPQGDKDRSGKAQAEQYINKYQRCFACHNFEEPSNYEDITIIKPYLLLPNNDPKGEPIRYLLDTPEKALKKAYKDDGVTFRDEIAFEGLVKMLLRSTDNPDEDVEEAFKTNLSVGYKVAYTILSMAGLLNKYMSQPYEDRVYAYLYDLDPSTLISVSSLVNRIRQGDKYVETDEDKLQPLQQDKVADMDLESATPLAPLPEYLTQPTAQPVGTPQAPVSTQTSTTQAPLPSYLTGGTPNPVSQNGTPTPIPDMATLLQTGFHPSTETLNELYGNMGGNEQGDTPLMEEEQLKPFTPSETPNERELFLMECIQSLQAQIQGLQNQIPTPQVQPNMATNQYAFPESQGTPMVNSVNCYASNRVKTSKLKTMLMNTPLGASMYMNDLWKNVLLDATDMTNGGMNKFQIVRMSVYSENLYLNDRLINLSGIVNGPDGVRLSDIINFKESFKFFRGMRVLSVDTDVLPKLLMEYNVKDFVGLFSAIPQLQALCVLHTTGCETVNRVDVMKAKANSQVQQRLEKQAQHAASNQYTEYEKNKAGLIDNWKSCTQGQKVWLAGTGVKCMDQAFAPKSKGLVKRTLWFTAGTTLGLGGLAAWLGVNGLKTIATTIGGGHTAE